MRRRRALIYDFPSQNSNLIQRKSDAKKLRENNAFITNNIIQIEVFQPSLHISPNHVDISQMRKTFNKVCNSMVLQTQKKELRLLYFPRHEAKKIHFYRYIHFEPTI